MKIGQRVTSLILSIILVNMSFGTAMAGMVGNTAILAQSAERQSLIQQLQQAEVREQLLSMGVQPEAVELRIQQLSDAEIAQLNRQIAEAPAGSGVVELVVLVFLVFVITDVIGATDIFPFIHPVNQK